MFNENFCVLCLESTSRICNNQKCFNDECDHCNDDEHICICAKTQMFNPGCHRISYKINKESFYCWVNIIISDTTSVKYDYYSIDELLNNVSCLKEIINCAFENHQILL